METIGQPSGGDTSPSRGSSRPVAASAAKNPSATALGCVFLVLSFGGCLAFCGRGPTKTSPSPEEVALQRDRVAALRKDIEAMNNLVGLFVPASTEVNGEMAAVRVLNTWYDLPERSKHDLVNSVSMCWWRIYGKDDYLLIICDEGNGVVAGHGPTGDYVER